MPHMLEIDEMVAVFAVVVVVLPLVVIAEVRTW
jgi:hypothetical protein